ncbi:hypothetical protein LUZ61_012491 [Rhynchospora tenuis]|uniref:Diacylglycerol O-acyltransferase 3, cytosolic n=1 Tax=Rhynchospora tenuis TaxID=198213 RepID=A0AAD6A371_9POAL|nr:hypothetical protein LUZ61_012491 [Rhynchospora tenuis]
MEISGAVLRRSATRSVHHRLLFGRSDGGAPRRPSARVRVPVRATCGGAVFLDEGHLKYYDERREKQEKKRAKLIKTLKKDLSKLYSMGFGIDNDQSDKIEEAAKQLLEQLNQIKVEEKEMKKKKKEEKKKKAKAACNMVCDEDSSTSSESSESDCEEPRILQLSDLKANTSSTLTVPNPVSTVPLLLSAPAPVPAPAPLPLPAPALALMQAVPVADVVPAGKIEVCMGGKCKKSGSMDLLREFEMKVGNEGGAVVVGCKCMGKCKEGPNVRVSSFDSGTTGMIGGESVSIMRDQLCIGVGLDDVGTIVAHFFGEEKQDDAGRLIPA